MKIIPGKKSEFGNFELQPEAGWKISGSFIDHESKLLVVRTGLIDTSHLKAEHGIISLPHKEYIIDQKIPAILDHQGWKKYFNYENLVTKSGDGKLELHTQRCYDEERNTDYIREFLYKAGTDEKLSESTGIAFREDKTGGNLIDSYYEHQRQREEYEKCLEKGEYSWDLHLKHLRSLNAGDVIFEYYTNARLCMVKSGVNCISLFSCPLPANEREWKNPEFHHEKNFNTLMGFWAEFTFESDWYMHKNPRIGFHPVMEYYIIGCYNNLVEKQELNYAQHEGLSQWINAIWRNDLHKSLFWQFCAHCKNRVYFNPRYPKHLCRACNRLVTDGEGNLLDFENVHDMKYAEGKYKVVIEKTGKEVKLYIGDQEYTAEESRFGGTVLQKKE